MAGHPRRSDSAEPYQSDCWEFWPWVDERL